VAMSRAPGQVAEQDFAIGTHQPATGAIAPARQQFQVAAVGIQAGPGQAAFGPGGVEEAGDGARVVLAQRRQGHRQFAALGGGAWPCGHRVVPARWWRGQRQLLAHRIRRRAAILCAMQATPPPASDAATTTDERPSALVPWRLLSLFYDLWPVVALW